MSNTKCRKIAVIGLPQSGKSSLSHALQELADKQQQAMQFVEIHDPDELHGHAYDVVLQVVDSTRLEESLMLTPHFIDEHQKIVLAIGRYDLLLKTDHSLNLPKLEQLIGVPTCRVSVRLNDGLPNCLDILETTIRKPASTAHPIYHLRDQGDEDTYRAYVHGILTETLTHAKDDKHQTSLERIDKVLTNPWLGFPIMMAILYFVFWCTFTLGAYPQAWIDGGIDAMSQWLWSLLTPSWWSSLLIDGVLQGVGAVLAFLPNIIILFFFISLMEDSGYMAREAYIMDTIMHHVGLHGRSFIPMLMGTGGNSGAQASTAVIRSLSLGDTEPKDALRVMWKEWRVAAICGLTLAAVNFVKMLLLDGMLLHNDSVTVAVAATVSVSIVFIVMFAKVVGSMLPIIAEKVGVDPAVMANPLISTVTDAVSLLIYINIAKLILHI